MPGGIERNKFDRYHESQPKKESYVQSLLTAPLRCLADSCNPAHWARRASTLSIALRFQAGVKRPVIPQDLAASFLVRGVRSVVRRLQTGYMKPGPLRKFWKRSRSNSMN